MAALDQRLLQQIINCEDAQCVCDSFTNLYDNSVYPPTEVYRNLFLCASIQYGHSALIDILLVQQDCMGKDVLSYATSRPLHTAVVHGGVDLVKQLLQSGLDVHQEGAGGIWRPGSACMDIGTPLLLAIQKDDPQMMNALRPFYQCQKTRQKHTPLHHTCKYNAVNCFLCLLQEEGDFDVNARDDQGMTPLMFAVQKSSELVKYLLEKGADVNAVMYRVEHTALDLTLIPSRENRVTNPLDVVTMLVTSGADVTHVTSQGEDSALTLLCNNLFPLGTNPSQADSHHHNRQALQCAKYLINSSVLQAKCRSNPITSVLLKLYSLAGTLPLNHSQRPNDHAQVRVVESAFLLAKDLINLFLENNVEANSSDNRARKTAAGQVVWILDSRSRHAWLTGNPYLSNQQPGHCFIMNSSLTATMLAIFTRLILYGSDITSPPLYTSLFNLLRVDFEQFLPFLLRFLNSLPHTKWVVVQSAFRLYIKDLQDKLSADQLLVYEGVIKLRTLRQMCQAVIIQCIQPTGSPIIYIEELPLPKTIRESIINLND